LPDKRKKVFHMAQAVAEGVAELAARDVRKLLEDVTSGRIVAIAATVKYADGSVRYIPIGQAPDPLAGMAAWFNE